MNDAQFKQLEENLTHHYRMLVVLQGKHLSETGSPFYPGAVGNVETPPCRRGCELYTLDNSPEIEIYYKADPENGVEIHDILIHGQEVSGPVYDLLEARDWESEIEAESNERADYAKGGE